LFNRIAAFAVLAFAAALLAPQPAAAIPIFAQRYNLRCDACHSVLPELNQFGNEFRNRGYRLDGVPKHGTTLVALREQVGYTPTPTDGTTRKTVPAGAVLGALEVGQIEAFVHETLGSEGSTSSLFLGYLAYRNPNSGILYRAGLVELPLVHSPAQRNDTLTTYGYEGTLVGLNDLTLATPRWALEAEQNVGPARIAATVAFANATGSVYGGTPVVTGRTESFAAPELGIFARVPIGDHLQLGVDALSGVRSISVGGGPAFADPYQRFGTSIAARHGRLDLLAEQWWGHDGNADGAGGNIPSDGGFVRLRWALGSHAFIGIREDGAAAPSSTRSLLWFAEAHVTPHARVLIQETRPIAGGRTSLQAALTVGVPWPRGK